jgi:scyllo-inositol 2-dehydrogenase (NADP+)
MKFLIVGYGIQGKKREKVLSNLKLECVGIVDPLIKGVDFKTLNEVPLNSYDIVIICTPEKIKYKLIKFCIKNKKHIMVEKPFNIDDVNFKILQKDIIKNKLIFYIAYNHRFENSLVDMKKLIQDNFFGKLYHCNLFYGNGTAKNVKKSIWRDVGQGVISDLGSHLIDLSDFLFDMQKIGKFKLVAKNNFENKAPDYCLITNTKKVFKINMEVSLCSWKNTFRCDVYGEKGSGHIQSLTKWSDSSLIIRKRVLPSGLPKEKIIRYKYGDQTWFNELKYFINLIKQKKLNKLKKDFFINHNLKNIK